MLGYFQKVACGTKVIMSNTKKLIDIGANLTDSMYNGIYNGTRKHESDLQQVLQRSWEANVDKIIITGGSLSESKASLQLSMTDDRLFTTVGCHPTRCKEFEDGIDPQVYLEGLKAIIQEGKSKVVAIGECGLDYDRVQFCDIETQKKYFQLQLTLAADLKLPLFLHCRNAFVDLHDILKKYPKLFGVVHSFDGSKEDAQKFIDLGYYIGLNGCSLKTEENLKVVEDLPVNKILLETDAPWCEVRPSHAGYKYIKKEHILNSTKKEKWTENCLVKSRNEPCNIRQILDIVSSVKKVSVMELANIIYDNTSKLFF